MNKLINKEELLKYVSSMADLLNNLSVMEKILVTKEYLRVIEIFNKLNEGKALRETLEKMNTQLNKMEDKKNDFWKERL